MVGNHSGGYDGFHFDITEQIRNGSTQGVPLEIVVGVFDPTEQGDQPHGKQSMGVFAATKVGEVWVEVEGGGGGGGGRCVEVERVPTISRSHSLL